MAEQLVDSQERLPRGRMRGWILDMIGTANGSAKAMI